MQSDRGLPSPPVSQYKLFGVGDVLPDLFISVITSVGHPLPMFQAPN